MRYLDLYLMQLAVINGACCLRLHSLRVPASLRAGGAVRLSCEFRLEGGERLYSLKWFHNGEEFLRFEPEGDPDVMYFPTRGVHVDLGSTTNTTVVLRDPELRTTGVFRCEVAADAPFFRTAAAEAAMTVGDYYSGAISNTLPTSFIIFVMIFIWI